MTVFAIQRATHAKRVWMSTSCERCNNESAKLSIQFVRRYYDTRKISPLETCSSVTMTTLHHQTEWRSSHREVPPARKTMLPLPSQPLDEPMA